MRRPILWLACAALLAVSFAAGAAEPCRYSAPRNAEIDAAGLQRLSVQIGPDDLVIRGEPGITKIEVSGTACASREDWLKDVQVETARHGESASVVARDGDHHVQFSPFGGSYAYLKLDVRVPQALAVKLTEGSGDADVAGVGALDASVGSGDLKVHGIAGAFALSVGSGDVVASDVGNLALSSVGSGDVNVDGVRGEVRVDGVGSGGLGLRHVTGGVSVGSVASGDVKLAGVGGNVALGSIGSGDVGIRDAKGDVTVKAVASGDVRIERAGGSVRADSVGSGDFGANGVGGDFSVGSLGSGDLHHRGVKGKVSIPRTDD